MYDFKIHNFLLYFNCPSEPFRSKIFFSAKFCYYKYIYIYTLQSKYVGKVRRSHKVRRGKNGYDGTSRHADVLCGRLCIAVATNDRTRDKVQLPATFSPADTRTSFPLNKNDLNERVLLLPHPRPFRHHSELWQGVQFLHARLKRAKRARRGRGCDGEIWPPSKGPRDSRKTPRRVSSTCRIMSCIFFPIILVDPFACIFAHSHGPVRTVRNSSDRGGCRSPASLKTPGLQFSGVDTPRKVCRARFVFILTSSGKRQAIMISDTKKKKKLVHIFMYIYIRIYIYGHERGGAYMVFMCIIEYLRFRNTYNKGEKN